MKRLVLVGGAKDSDNWCREHGVHPGEVTRVFERRDVHQLAAFRGDDIVVVQLDVPHREITDMLTMMASRAGMVPGVFVVFEGGEGAGKTTQVRLLAAHLRRRAREVVVTREPGATRLGGAIRRLLLDRGRSSVDELPSDRAEVLLFAADRAQHVAMVVRPALARGAVVISDRYVDSSLAYQGAGREIDDEQIRSLSTFATDGLVPALTVLLDVPAGTGLARAAQRGGVDRMEAASEAFHERVRRRFLVLAAAEPDRYLVVDALEPEDVIAVEVAAAVDVAMRSASPYPDLRWVGGG